MLLALKNRRCLYISQKHLEDLIRLRYTVHGTRAYLRFCLGFPGQFDQYCIHHLFLCFDFRPCFNINSHNQIFHK